MLLEVSVCAARIERLREELAVARYERDAAVRRAVEAGASRIQVVERLRSSRRLVWSILRAAS